MANFKNRLFNIIISVIVLGASVAITASLIKSKKPPQKKEPEEYIPLVEYTVAEKTDYRAAITAYGRIKEADIFSVSSEVSGKITYVSSDLKEGDHLKKGEVIAKIDTLPYELRLAEAEFELSRAELNHLLEEEMAKSAKEEWGKLRKGEITRLASRKPYIKEARSRLKLAQTRFKDAEKDLRNTTIRSDINGIVLKKHISEGTFISEGSLLAELYSSDSFEVKLSISENDIHFLKGSGIGEPVRITYESNGGAITWNGTLVRINAVVDKSSQSVSIIAVIDKPYENLSVTGSANPSILLPGLFVRAEIMGESIKNSFVIERSLLTPRNEVLIIDTDNRIRVTSVKVTRFEGKSAIVTDGLKNGDRICISRLYPVIDGMKVKLPEEKDK